MRLLLCGLLAAMLLGSAAEAGDLQDEAIRQVELAKSDFASGVFDRAVSACDSALRLDPAQREAFRIKGFALEQLGRDKEALAMLRAYQSLSTGITDDGSVSEGIARLEEKLEVRVSPVPVILLVGGGTVAAGGAITAISAWARVQQEKTYGYYWGSPTQYEAQRQTHVVGVVVAGIGGGMAIAGVLAGVLQRAKIRKSTRIDGPTAMRPWMGAGPGGASVGIVGRW